MWAGLKPCATGPARPARLKSRPTDPYATSPGYRTAFQVPGMALQAIALVNHRVLLRVFVSSWFSCLRGFVVLSVCGNRNPNSGHRSPELTGIRDDRTARRLMG